MTYPLFFLLLQPQHAILIVMSQEKSDGMSPTELVESWRRKSKFLHNYPDDYAIGVRAGIEACVGGLELEIKRSNYVSGKEATENEIVNQIYSTVWEDVNNGTKVRNIAKLLASKYRVIER